MAKEHCCRACIYYEPQDGTPEFGECRRKPPVIIYRVDLAVRDRVEVPDGWTPAGFWPLVEQDEWCGEFCPP